MMFRSFDPGDAIGRLQTQSDAYPSFSGSNVGWTFTLNPASQIASEVHNNDAYTFGGVVANGLNQHLTAGSANFTYDTRGNLTGDGTSTFGYSSENLLTSITSSGTTKTLAYDPALRLYQLSGTTTTRFAYDGLNAIAENDGSGNVLHRYVYDPTTGQPVMEYAGNGAGSSFHRFYSTDERGSITSVTDINGNLIGINRYDEYGIPQSTNTGRFGYTGQMWLSEVGLQYSKARIYSPYAGRFLQTDPIEYDDGLNWYAYVHNDPVNGIDPLGLCAGSNGISTGPGSVTYGYDNGTPETIITCPAEPGNHGSTGFGAGMGDGAQIMEAGSSGPALTALNEATKNAPNAPQRAKASCTVSQQDSAITGAVAGSAAELPHLAKLGWSVARGTAIRSIILTAGAEEATSVLAIVGGPVTLAVLAVGVGVYAYDRYSGGKITRFINRQLGQFGQIGEGCK